ncbi:hypothetical protein LTR97_004833 [Elasticomyces elasticus]|uniref:NACHT domain-containing protein n=1 Tax=Elasticomyces elasticus TaxID=574655 RepID=A0AAN7WB81_9PEZI|nr:hypothetical protein LTR97_004833 [Elasticomyces elasticus]
MDDGRRAINVNIGDLTTLGPSNTVNAGVFFNGQEDPTAKLDKCRDNIFLTDPQSDRDELISVKGKRVHGTCEWIERDAKYKSWLSGETNLLWICGGPGKGKTVLSIYLTQRLMQAHTIYYFCSSNDRKRNGASTVLRGLIWHITELCPEVADQLVELRGDVSGKRVQATLGSRETLWRIFTRIVHDPRSTVTCCVLDGLDECDEISHRWLIAKFTDLLSEPSRTGTGIASSFKLMIVSRPEVSGLARCAQIKLDPNNNELVGKDIRRFVATRVEDLATNISMSKGLRLEVEETLLERSQGTFLWVGFAMLELLKKGTALEVSEVLNALPEGLPSMYSRMLLQIHRHNRFTSLLILQCVTVSVAPLDLLELAVAIGTLESKHITQEQTIRDQIKACGAMIRIDTGTVELVHQSARDYLLRDEVDENAILEQLRVKPEEAHLQMAQACVRCIEQVENFGEPHRLRNEDKVIERYVFVARKPLDDYAIDHWADHAGRCGRLVVHLLEQSPLFGEKSSLRDKWWAEYAEYLSEPNMMAVPADIHLACYLGIVPWVQALLRDKRKPSLTSLVQRSRKLVNVCDSAGRSPLWWAICAGDVVVVQLLLQEGAQPNTHKATGNAFILACRKGHDRIVNLLLAAGTDINARGEEYGSALQAASHRGHEIVVRTLLAAGASVDTQSGFHGSALQAACSEGHESTVQLLLAAGASVNAQGGEYGNALQAACAKGHQSTVQLLLQEGAEVNAQGGLFGNALQVASYFDHEETVQLLLQTGANVNAQGGKHGNALQAASVEGHEDTVRILLAAGADVNAEGGPYMNGLQAASANNHRETVRILLAAGADVNAHSADHGNAFEAACYWRHVLVMRLLLEHGAVEQWRSNSDGQKAQEYYQRIFKGWLSDS